MRYKMTRSMTSFTLSVWDFYLILRPATLIHSLTQLYNLTPHLTLFSPSTKEPKRRMSDLKHLEKSIKKESKQSAKELDQAHKDLEKAIKAEKDASVSEQNAWKAREKTIERENKTAHKLTHAEHKMENAKRDVTKSENEIARAQGLVHQLDNQVAEKKTLIDNLQSASKTQEAQRSAHIAHVKETL